MLPIEIRLARPLCPYFQAQEPDCRKYENVLLPDLPRFFLLQHQSTNTNTPSFLNLDHFSVTHRKLSASAIQSNCDKSPTKSESYSAETNWSSELQRFLFLASALNPERDWEEGMVEYVLHQKTLCPVVGAEGEDFAFAVCAVSQYA